MISIDTGLLKQLAGVARGTNEAISEASDLLNQVATHNDWGCMERHQINEFTMQNKNTIRRLQEAGRSFYRAIESAVSDFEVLERQFPSMFNNVDGLLGAILSIPVRTSQTVSGNAAQILSNVGKAISNGSGSSKPSVDWTRMTRSLTSGIRVTDFKSLDLSGANKK